MVSSEENTMVSKEWSKVFITIRKERSDLFNIFRR